MILLVGDVQGCALSLQHLLAQADFSPSRDRVVLLGDLVNRGPDSLGVLKLLSGLGNAASCLLGNHDLHLLAAAHGVRKVQRGDTFSDVLDAPDAAHWVHWLAQQPLALEEAGWLCVHAGVVPQWDKAQTLALAAEVHEALRGPDRLALLSVMYGDQPLVWSAALQGDERARFVINALTRIRFCSADGRLDLKSKEGAGSAPDGHLPWFDVPTRRTRDQPMAFGHWSTLGLVNTKMLLGIDTGCVWGGSLTAVRVDGGRRELLQVPCEQAQRPGA